MSTKDFEIENPQDELETSELLDENGAPIPAYDGPAAETFSQCFGSAQQVMNRYQNCAICGSHLHFTHITDFSRNLTQELAQCPECGIKARNALHRLQ